MSRKNLKQTINTFFLLLLTIFVTQVLYSQNNDLSKYMELVSQAREQYQAKNFQQSANLYKNAFDSNMGKAHPTDKYMAASSFAMAGDKDSAFNELFDLANNYQFSDHARILQDQNLISLHNDERWEKLLSNVKTNKIEEEKLLDLPLVAVLDSIYDMDQKNRGEVMNIMTKYGERSSQMDSLWQLIDKGDSLNQKRVTELLDDRGWLGEKTVGKKGTLAIFLVIQHSDLPTQVKYLPLLRKAVADGTGNPTHLAYLEDRVALRQGKGQIYGTQTGFDPETSKNFLSPLIDPDNVDERRAELGLDPLNVYLKNFNIEWDLEEYKRMLPEIERKQWEKK